jgi:hypothetical protein
LRDVSVTKLSFTTVRKYYDSLREIIIVINSSIRFIHPPFFQQHVDLLRINRLRDDSRLDAVVLRTLTHRRILIRLC